MPETLVVFGATGQQGGALINYVLNDAELSQRYKIRAVTRNVQSEAAKKLQEKVEVVHGDALDRSSLETVFSGADFAFIMTTPTFAADGAEIEANTAKLMADVAVEKGLKYIIFSTLPSVRELSGGKYSKGVHFEGKALAEQYIRGLSIKSAFFCPGFFMENFHAMPFLAPQKVDDKTWALTQFNSPKALMPLIDITNDTGKYVGAILAEPDKYEGKTFFASTAMYSLEETAAIMSAASGKNVVYRQVSLDEWKQSLPFAPDIMGEVFSYPDEFGFFGPDTKNLVAWAAENARGKVTTLKEHLVSNPLDLN